VQLDLDAGRAEDVMRRLLDSGRVVEQGGALVAVNLFIPAGTNEGVETALLDHFRAAVSVIAERVAKGPDPTGRSGGSTFSFNVDRSHPHFDAINDLLDKTRTDVQALWDKVMDVNAVMPPSRDALEFTFYVGQSVVDPGLETASTEPDATASPENEH
jgi:hypothetical protein